VRLVRDPAEAEDLALETFLRLSRQDPAVSTNSHLEGWLYRVATNLGLQSIRSFLRREHYELSAGKRDLEDSPENQPAEIAAGAEERYLARLVLARMKPKQARLLVLRYSGLSYKEVARALDLSPTSIGPLLFRAEREFEKGYRDVLQEEQ
jgi:RNA polymerase sigma-70 factor (ECF subfamily)